METDHGGQPPDPLSNLTPAALLAAEQDGVLARRALDAASALRLLAWCDLASGDPQQQPGAAPVACGGDRLVQVGGDGTPPVADLAFAEFAIAARAGVVATRHRAGDLLDLRHRLPLLFAAVCALEVEVWVARRIASLSRRLDRVRVGLVDQATSAAVGEAPSRLLEIAEAAVIEADPDLHRARIEADAAAVGVWSRRPRPGQRVQDVDGAPATRGVGARVSEAGAEALMETVDHLADRLASSDAAHDMTRDQLRAWAFETLADPAAAAELLGLVAESRGEEAGPPPTPPAAPPRQRAQVVVHLHHDVWRGLVDAPARVEGIGPMLLDQLPALLRGREISLLPVIDLADSHAVNGYEFPEQVRRRTLLRTIADVFPHSGRRGTARLDHDHATPYRAPSRGGPPGQTGDHNDAPLARSDHRAKTHRGYTVRQLGFGLYFWRTPQGLHRLVTPAGTHDIDPVVLAEVAALVAADLARREVA